MQNGGDHISGFFGDKYYDVARKFCKQTVCKERVEKIVDSREIGLRDKKRAQIPLELNWNVMVDGSARHGSCLFTNILTRI